MPMKPTDRIMAPQGKRELTPYQKRLLRSLQDSIENVNRMMARDPGEPSDELMQRLPAIRTQLMQGAVEASELYGAISQHRYPE